MDGGRLEHHTSQIFFTQLVQVCALWIELVGLHSVLLFWLVVLYEVDDDDNYWRNSIKKCVCIVCYVH